MCQKLTILTNDIDDSFKTFVLFFALFLSLQVIARNHILLVVVYGSPLASVEFYSVDYLDDSVHRNDLLDVLLL